MQLPIISLYAFRSEQPK